MYFTNPVHFISVIFILKTMVESTDLLEGHRKQLIEHFTGFGAGCLANHTVTFDDVTALQAFQVPESREAKCFFACILRKAGIMDVDGKIDSDEVPKFARDLVQNEDELNAVVSLFTSCAFVNDMDVKDGNEGCDRANLLLTCIMEKSKGNGRSERLTKPTDNYNTTRRKRDLRTLISSLIKALLQLACRSIDKDKLHGKIITKLVPGLGTVSSLCVFLS